MITEENLKDIVELNKEIKSLIELDSPSNKTIITESDFDYDFRAKVEDLSVKDIKKALTEGLFLRDIHLYGEDKKNHKHKKDCCYCIQKFRKNLIYVRCLLIGLYKKPTFVSLFHMGYINKGSIGERVYTEIKKKLKEPYL